MATRDNNEFDPTKPSADAKLYREGVTHGDRLKSSFDSSQILGTNNNLFGWELSGASAGVVRSLIDQSLPYLATYLGDHSIKISQKFALNHITDNPALAQKYGKRLGTGIAYGMMAVQPIAEIASSTYSLSNRLSESRKAIVPVLKANGHATAGAGIFSDSHNEIVANARKKIFTGYKNDLIGAAARSVSIIPSFYIFHQHQKGKIAEQADKAELEMLATGAGTPEQFDKYIDKQVGSNVDLSLKFDAQLQKRLTEGRKKYYSEFKKFEGRNRTAVEKEIADAIKDETVGVYMNRFGLSYSHHGGRRNRGNQQNQHTPTEEAEKYKKLLVDRRMKERFAQEGGMGAWNEEFMPAQQNSRKRAKTREEVITEYHEKTVQQIQEQVNGEKNKPKNKEQEAVVTSTVQGIFSIGAEVLRSMVTRDTNKSLEEKIALDMILNFRRQLDENRTRETIPGGTEKNQSEEYSYAQYVHKIFQENQSDSGLSEIGDRYVKSMRAVSWKDEDIQKMKDSDLGEYEVAIKHISQCIRDGRMDPMALINLVGERKIVQRSGKSFGTLKTADQADLKENIIAEIDHQAALLRPNHKMDQNEVSEALGNYTFTKEELQAAFSNHGLGADAKAFLFTLLDMNTPDDEVLKDLTGRPEKEIKQLRLDAQKHFSNEMDAALREIAEDLDNNPAALARYDLTEEEASRFTSVYKKAKESGASLGDTLNADNRNKVASSVANILVDDSLHHNGRLWTERIVPRAKKTEVDNKEEAKAKQEEKEQMKEEALANETSFSERVNESDPANDNYTNSPVVTKDIQEASQERHRASHAKKPRKGSAHQDMAVAP